MSDSKGAAIDKILTEMVEDTVMIITNDLPSLLQHEETYEIRRHHKNEILKNLPEAKQAILALLAQEVKQEVERIKRGARVLDKDGILAFLETELERLG